MNPTFRHGLAAAGALAICVTGLATSGAAQATASDAFFNPVTRSTSTYAAVDSTMSWDQDRDAAAASVDPTTGCHGHLAVITSQAEQDKITQVLGAQGGRYIGAQRTSSDGPFAWITGETFDYNDFDGGQPDNYQGAESVIQLAFYKTDNTWNDIAPDPRVEGQNTGFVVEYECQRATVAGNDPARGPASGGTSVVITGTNFTGATRVLFGQTPATSFTVDSDTQITAVSPAYTGTIGKKGAVVKVRVHTSGLSTKTPATKFTYVASPTA